MTYAVCLSARNTARICPPRNSCSSFGTKSRIDGKSFCGRSSTSTNTQPRTTGYRVHSAVSAYRSTRSPPRSRHRVPTFNLRPRSPAIGARSRSRFCDMKVSTHRCRQEMTQSVALNQWCHTGVVHFIANRTTKRYGICDRAAVESNDVSAVYVARAFVVTSSYETRVRTVSYRLVSTNRQQSQSSLLCDIPNL